MLFQYSIPEFKIFCGLIHPVQQICIPVLIHPVQGLCISGKENRRVLPGAVPILLRPVQRVVLVLLPHPSTVTERKIDFIT